MFLASQPSETYIADFIERSHDIFYHLRAVSKPRAALARVGYPIARGLQARFRRDSILAVRRAIEGEQ